MKKYLFYISLALCVVFVGTLCMTSCKKKAQLPKLVEQLNEKCPINKGAFTLTKVAVEGNYLTYYESADTKQLEGVDEAAKKEELLKSFEEENGRLATELVKENMGVMYVYYDSSDSTKTKKVTFEPSELGSVIK